MHAVVMDSLEEYLSGTISPAQRMHMEAHLGTCGTCRDAVQGMFEVSDLMVSLRSEVVIEPSAGFLAGVMLAVGERPANRSFASLFMPDFGFARRLVFASLMTLAVLGGYLASHEASAPDDAISPDALLAQQDSPSFNSAPSPDNMLVTLTAYDRH